MEKELDVDVVSVNMRTRASRCCFGGGGEFLDHLSVTTLPSIRSVLRMLGVICIVIIAWPDVIADSATHELFTGCKQNISGYDSFMAASAAASSGSYAEPEAEPKTRSEPGRGQSRKEEVVGRA